MSKMSMPGVRSLFDFRDGAPAMPAPGTRMLGMLCLAALFVLTACSPEEEVLPTVPMSDMGQRDVPNTDFSIHLQDVTFRPGAALDIHVRVFVNESFPCRGRERTAFAVHGLNHTANTWERLAEAFFRGPRSDQLCRLAAVDLPGSGKSGIPDPAVIPFGNLLIQDYVTVLIEVLDRLADRGVRPRIAMGHSQGTQTLQTLQQALLERGTSLADRFGITKMVTFGTIGPREAPNAPGPAAPLVEEAFATALNTTEERGTHFDSDKVGPEFFVKFWFSNLELELSSRAPSPAEVEANGWDADDPLLVVLQTAGLSGFRRPSVQAGAFGPEAGTRLQVVDFADDPWSLTANAREIYLHLTGDESLSGFVSLDDPAHEAVHDLQITDPARVRNAVALP